MRNSCRQAVLGDLTTDCAHAVLDDLVTDCAHVVLTWCSCGAHERCLASCCCYFYVVNIL